MEGERWWERKGEGPRKKRAAVSGGVLVLVVRVLLIMGLVGLS
jgi:hypothetical protein